MFKEGINLVLDLWVKFGFVQNIGLRHVNGEVVTSHAIRVAGHMTDCEECCVATRPMHVIV